MTVRTTTVLEALALYAALQATFDALHPACDQWAQRSADAANKRLQGTHQVYYDGKPVDGNPPRPGEPTLTANQLARRATTRHVANYSVIQLAAALTITRALGYRVPARALLAGTAINAGTHAALDRGPLMKRLAKLTKKDGYIDACHAVRFNKEGELVRHETGPGTAWIELDAAAHRAIGPAAAVVITLLAIRVRRK